MIIVSACLAGVECRYNGQAFPISTVIEMVKKGQAIPLCPEILGNLSIPRPSAEQCDGKILSNDGHDVTSEYVTGAKIALGIAQLVGCKKAILKSKSPTCGCGMIYDGTFSGKMIAGEGIFSKMLKEENIKVYTENEIQQCI
ncbi:DUF523 domain-containing protein [Pelosinus sp. sgz500959]|uniref:DUF523 domain-containing protein n=1 Tax=Pelosinus sp. sgz500959 TaxID=3242472 RepID=UPI00367093D6